MSANKLRPAIDVTDRLQKSNDYLIEFIFCCKKKEFHSHQLVSL